VQVYINRRPIKGPWGGGAHFINAYHKLASRNGIKVLPNNDGSINPDVILIVGLDNDGNDISVEQAIMYKMYMKPSCQIILRVNENDARKGTSHVDDILLKVSEHIDGAVFVSKWLRDYFLDKGWACKNNTVIYNGVDREIFKPQPKLNNGKVNIVTHHWSDNRMKGADIYEALDEFVGKFSDRFSFTYIGRHKCDFKYTKVIKPLSGKALGEELGKYDVYISASRFDPGPNHVIESIACELPTYVHVDGGGSVEFAGKDHVYYNWNELKQFLLDGQFKVNSTSFETWNSCVQQYNDFIKSVWENRDVVRTL
jgi:glycosyltransferase involved in cell wall biosynthesis